MVAVAVLAAVALWAGSALRYNIVQLERRLDRGGSPVLLWLERASKVALALAYVVAIAFYLELLGAFLLRGIGVTDPLAQKGIATAVLAAVALFGIPAESVEKGGRES